MQTKECCSKCFIKDSCTAEMTCAEKKALIKKLVRKSVIAEIKQKLATENAAIIKDQTIISPEEFFKSIEQE